MPLTKWRPLKLPKHGPPQLTFFWGVCVGGWLLCRHHPKFSTFTTYSPEAPLAQNTPCARFTKSSYFTGRNKFGNCAKIWGRGVFLGERGYKECRACLCISKCKEKTGQIPFSYIAVISEQG